MSVKGKVKDEIKIGGGRLLVVALWLWVFFGTISFTAKSIICEVEIK